MLKFLALASALFLQVAHAKPSKAPPEKIPTIVKLDGDVEFLAVGSPGFLKISGKGAKAVGTAAVTDGVATGHFIVALEDLKTGIELRDKHMKEKYLETPKWRDAYLDLDAWKVTDTSTKFSGKLTLKGVSKPVFGTAAFHDGVLRAEFEIDLKDFPVGVPSHLGVTVAEDVTVVAKLKVTK